MTGSAGLARKTTAAASSSGSPGRPAGTCGSWQARLYPSGLGFYIALACFKLAVILEGIHYRHLHGQTVGAGYERVGALAKPLVEVGLAALKEHI